MLEYITTGSCALRDRPLSQKSGDELHCAGWDALTWVQKWSTFARPRLRLQWLAVLFWTA